MTDLDTAAYFDKKSRIKCPWNRPFRPRDAITGEVIFFSDTTAHDRKTTCILSCHGFELGLFENSYLSFTMKHHLPIPKVDGEDDATSKVPVIPECEKLTLSGSLHVQPGQWHHVMFAWCRKTMRTPILIVDGRRDSGTEIITELKEYPWPLHVGQELYIGSAFQPTMESNFKGLIREARIWKQAIGQRAGGVATVDRVENAARFLLFKTAPNEPLMKGMERFVQAVMSLYVVFDRESMVSSLEHAERPDFIVEKRFACRGVPQGIVPPTQSSSLTLTIKKQPAQVSTKPETFKGLKRATPDIRWSTGHNQDGIEAIHKLLESRMAMFVDHTTRRDSDPGMLPSKPTRQTQLQFTPLSVGARGETVYPPRVRGACTLVNHRLYFLGGVDADGEGDPNDDAMYYYDLESKDWGIQPTRGAVPPPRDGHTMTTHGENIILYGRAPKSRAMAMQTSGQHVRQENDVYLFHADGRFDWEHKEVFGNAILSRDSHAAVSFDRRVCFFGGQCFEYLNDVGILQPGSSAWEKVTIVGGNKPAGRAGALLLAHPTKDELICFGGIGKTGCFSDVFSFDPKLMVWSTLQPSGDVPSPRYGHTGFFLGEKILIMGGTDDRTNFYDVYTLDLGTLHWTRVDATCPIAGPGVRAFAYEDQFVICGGMSKTDGEDKHVNDVYIMSVSEVDAVSANRKEARCQATDRNALPESYLCNTPKEQAAIIRAQRFQHLFSILFPSRPPLLLAPFNECGVKKFVCSTIRPTQLSHRQVYELKSCAEFIANFCFYEPAATPNELPTAVVSPASTLTWQAGDAFDMSVALVSLLLGVGYDAFCVCGRAPTYIQQKDQTKTEFPEGVKLMAEPITEPELNPNQGYRKEIPLTKRNLKSKFLARLEEEKKQAAREAQEGAGKGGEGRLRESEGGVHCWVLVLAGGREMENNVFVEPSTGAVYEIPKSPYITVESVWNHANYWANLQDPTSLESMVFDFADIEKWASVLPPMKGDGTPEDDESASESDSGSQDGSIDGPEVIQTPGQQLSDLHRARAKANTLPQLRIDDLAGPVSSLAQLSLTGPGGLFPEMEQKKKGEGDDDVDSLLEYEFTEPLTDLPPSWVKKLYISKEQLLNRYSNSSGPIEEEADSLEELSGFKQIDYFRCTMQLFADYKSEDGKVSSLAFYDDAEKTVLTERRDWFVHRMDKLRMRVELPIAGKVIERFDQGRNMSLNRAEGLKEIFIDGKAQTRTLTFYPSARLDGLYMRKDLFGRKTVSKFRDRDDHLIHLSVAFDTDALMNQAVDPIEVFDYPIRKITEKFSRNPDKDAEEDVCKRVFYVHEGKYRLDYHLRPGRITRSSRIYNSDGTSTITQVDAFAKPPKKAMLLEEYQKLVTDCKATMQTIRESDREMRELLNNREKEEQSIKLVVSVYDSIRNRSIEVFGEEEESGQGKEEERDYLTPFLPPGKAFPLSPADSRQVRERCLKALKDRLIERANIITARLEEETQAVREREAQFQRNVDHVDPEEEEEFDRYCTQAYFRIHIYEQRLAHHEEQALEKYSELDTKLRKDHRLNLFG